VVGRFIAEMVYGINARGSVRLSEIARALEEDIPLIKTIDRLSENLAREGLVNEIVDRVAAEACARIKDDTLLTIDPSDISKRYAKKMEYLATVRDGSTGELSDGYWTCQVIGAQNGEPETMPLYMSLYSQESPEFVGENEEILKAVDSLCKHVKKRGVWVMDRGGDRENLLKPLLDRGLKFLIRLVGTRHLIYKGKAVSALNLALSCRLDYMDRIAKEERGTEKMVRLEYGYRKVKLPGREEPLYMVVVKGFGEEPMMPITNVEMRKNRKVLWWAVESYMTRWRIEETVRFVKQSYDLEDIRVLRYERLKNMMGFVLASAYFAAVHLGMKSKHQILARHAMNLSRRIFGIPDFRFYALADGIRELLMKAGKGISTCLYQDHPDPQSDLFAT